MAALRADAEASPTPLASTRVQTEELSQVAKALENHDFLEKSRISRKFMNFLKNLEKNDFFISPKFHLGSLADSLDHQDRFL